MFRTLDEVIEKARSIKGKKAVLVGAEDREGLIALKTAAGEGVVEPILVGDKNKVDELLDDIGLQCEVVDAKNAG